MILSQSLAQIKELTENIQERANSGKSKTNKSIFLKLTLQTAALQL